MCKSLQKSHYFPLTMQLYLTDLKQYTEELKARLGFSGSQRVPQMQLQAHTSRNEQCESKYLGHDQCSRSSKLLGSFSKVIKENSLMPSPATPTRQHISLSTPDRLLLNCWPDVTWHLLATAAKPGSYNPNWELCICLSATPSEMSSEFS